MLTRRDVLRLGYGLLPALSPAVQDRAAQSRFQFDTLIGRRFAGRVRLVHRASGEDIGYNFKPTWFPTNWDLKPGRYQGEYRREMVDLHGYWIFRPGTGQCWQASNHGDGALQYWSATGPNPATPEDWELFDLRVVDRGAATVNIYNPAYAPFRSAARALPAPARFGDHVRRNGDQFVCDAAMDDAAVFEVKFY